MVTITNLLPSGTATRGMAYIRAYAAQHGVTDLTVTVKTGEQRLPRVDGWLGVYGSCVYPTKRRPDTRLTLHVPGPFPISIRVHRPPVYLTDGRTPRPPAGCTFGDLKTATRATGEVRWYQVWSQTMLYNADDGLVWIFAHEWYHFACKAKLLRGRNDEIQADLFADALLAEFRKARR